MDRRRFLATAGASASVALAGCGGRSGPEGNDGDASGDTGGPGGTGTPDGARSIEDHPATADLTSQPHLGPLDGHVVVAFEDPACPNCGRFHRRTLPEIRSNLVEPGEGGFAVRTFPVLSYAWNEPAAKALEATFDRDASAFWALLGHVYETQGAFDESNVLDRAATFLTGETDLDGAAVAADVRAGEFDDAVRADLDAAEAGEIGRSTPTILLFRDGEYATTVTGPADYDVIAGTLGL